jgi:hypothetical protein
MQIIEKLKSLIVKRKQFEEQKKEALSPFLKIQKQWTSKEKEIKAVEDVLREQVLQIFTDDLARYEAAGEHVARLSEAGKYDEAAAYLEQLPPLLQVDGISLTLRKKVVIGEGLPEEYYLRVPDIKRIEKDALDGVEIQGVEVVRGYSLTVRT